MKKVVLLAAIAAFTAVPAVANAAVDLNYRAAVPTTILGVVVGGLAMGVLNKSFGWALFGAIVGGAAGFLISA